MNLLSHCLQAYPWIPVSRSILELACIRFSSNQAVSLFIQSGGVGTAPHIADISESKRMLQENIICLAEEDLGIELRAFQVDVIWSMGFPPWERVQVSRWSKGLSLFAAAVSSFTYAGSSLVVTLY